MANNRDNELDKQGLAAPVVDKFQLLPEFLKARGLVKQHLNSYNYFVRTGIKKIMRANNEIRSSFDPTIYLRYTDIRVGKPCITINSVSRDITPQECRLTGMTYAAPIFVDMEYMTKFGKREVKNHFLGKMPVMLRSSCCLLNGKDEEELARLGECPLDPGGYFVVKGTEKVILIQEQLSKNRIIIDTDSRGCIQASVVSSTETRKSKTVIVMEREKINLDLNQFTTKVPIMAVMKAMGME